MVLAHHQAEQGMIVQVLDSNGSGGLTSQEFCAAMRKLVRGQWMGQIVGTLPADSHGLEAQLPFKCLFQF